MASKVNASTALFFSFNLLFFVLVSSHNNVDSSSTGVGGILDDLLNGNGNGNGNGVVNMNDLLNNGNFPQGRCNLLNLGVCAKMLGLVDLELGNVPTQPCCSLIAGLVDLEVALCLCIAIRANVLGIINLDLPISLSVLLNNCGRSPALDYQCSP
ncbi:hypothetical protein REPUB_Repub13aG0134100 [Reevesia pubescens]